MDNNALPKANMFGGFKKKEVLSYIFELNESMQDSQQKQLEQIEELTKARDDLAGTLKEKDAKLAETQGRLSETARALESAVKEGEAARSLAESLKGQLQKREREIAEKNDSIARYTLENTQLTEKNRKFEEKSSKVEAAAAQIGGLFVQAREDADQVVAEAQRKAAEIIADAQSRAETLIREAEERADALDAKAKASAEAYIGDANENMRGMYSRFAGFCSEIAGIQQTVLGAADDIRKKMNEMGETVASAQKNAPEIPLVTLEEGMLAPSDEDCPIEAEKPAQQAGPVDISLANNLLDQYGIHKDEHGFFRLADN